MLILYLKGGKMKKISSIVPFESMSFWNQVSPDGRRKRKHGKKKLKSTVKQQLFALSRFIDENLVTLLAKNSPLRLRIYQKKEDILMDITTTNKTKKADLFFNRVITHDDVDKVIQRIHSGMGFVVDYSV